jgi:peptidylprolyl isomerase
MKLLPVVFAAGALCAQTPSPNQPQAPAGYLPAPKDDTVVAKVGDRNLTFAEVKAWMAGVPPQLQQAFQRDASGVLSSLALLEFLAAEGDKEKLAERSPAKEQIEYLRKTLVAQSFLDRTGPRFFPKQADVEKFYQEHPERFQMAKVSAIYLSFVDADAATEPGAKTRKEAEAKAEIEKVARQLAAGADFAATARKVSEDKESAEKGGEFGLIRKSDALDDAIKNAVFALKPGQITPPVKQANGYYLFRLDAYAVQPLDEVRDKLYEEIRQARFNEWFQETQKKYRVEVLPGYFGRPLP